MILIDSRNFAKQFGHFTLGRKESDICQPWRACGGPSQTFTHKLSQVWLGQNYVSFHSRCSLFEWCVQSFIRYDVQVEKMIYSVGDSSSRCSCGSTSSSSTSI